MFLIFFNVFYVFLGSACGLLHKKVCNGDSVEIDLHAHPFYKRLYFHPKEGGAMELLMANQEAKDPRLKVSTYSAKLTQLTEKDSGKFVIGRNFGGVTDVLSLTVSDCSLNISLLYGEELVRDVPSSAELLEFIPFHGLEEPQLMWERANPKMNYGGRGKIIEDVFIISKVTQKDNGFYNFKQKDKSMVLWLQLTVTEKMDRYEFREDDIVFIPFPRINEDWTVTFKQHSKIRDVKIIEAQRVFFPNNPFYHRMKVNDFAIEISHLKRNESGTFKFIDREGNLALVLEVIPSASMHFNPGIMFEFGTLVLIVFHTVGCGLCLRMFCCKNGKPPSQVAQTAQEPRTHYDDLNECEGSGFSAAPYPAAFPPPAVNVPFPPPAMNAGISHDAAAASSRPVAYQPTYEIKNISQPEVTPPASEKSAPSSSSGYNPVSSDYQPVFEVKGLNSTFDHRFLSTENSSADVYKSDKMNFL